MPNNSAHEADSQPTVYQIRVEGHLDDRWADWFGGLAIALEEDGNTLLVGPVVDQAALYGLLRRISDLGLALVSVNRIPAGRTGQRINPESESSTGPAGKTIRKKKGRGKR